jgi:hypothetical protein
VYENIIVHAEDRQDKVTVESNPFSITVTPNQIIVNDVTVDESATQAKIKVMLAYKTDRRFRILSQFQSNEAISQIDNRQNYDFNPSSGLTAIYINAGQSSVTFTVGIEEDDLDEEDETFTMSVTHNAQFTVLSDDQGIITIKDNDAPPTVYFSSTEALLMTYPEPYTASMNIVRLSTASGRDTFIPFTATDGTAVSGTQYQNLQSEGVTILAGNTTGVISLMPLDDGNDVEEALQLTLEASEYATVGSTVINTLIFKKQAFLVHKTGQTTSYATFDDGDLEKGKGITTASERFSDNGDGTILDKLTGLIWMKNTECFTQGTTFEGVFTELAELNAGSLNCAEYTGSDTDWRVPNHNELYSLVDYSQSSPALPENHPFNADSPRVWSSTSDTDDGAWGITFANGANRNNGKTYDGFQLWAVRDSTFNALSPVYQTGQTQSYLSGDDGDLRKGLALPSPRFSNLGDGSVLDHKTGLTWLKTPRCFEKGTWTQALENIASLNANTDNCEIYTGTKTDWRLPNMREVNSIIDKTQDTPPFSQGHPFEGFEKTYNVHIWLSTSNAPSPETQAWIMSMRAGYPHNGQTKTNDYYTWAVRGGQ